MKTLVRSAALALVAGAALAGPAAASPAQDCKAGAAGPFGEPYPSYSSCVSTEAAGKLTGTSFASQCRQITGGRYPFTFYGTVTVRNPGECLVALRGFHASIPG